MASFHSGGFKWFPKSLPAGRALPRQGPQLPTGLPVGALRVEATPSSTAQSIPIVVRLLLKKNILWLIKARS